MTMNRSTTHAHAKEAATAVAAPAPVVPHVIPPSTPPPPPPSNASGNKGGGGGPRGGIYDPFPIKFYRMLDQTRDEGLEAIVSWLSHGRAFRIHKPKVFEANVMPRFFNQSKYTSFQRQLNLYGFTRCCRGRDAGAYHHPLFLRGRRELLGRITRTKIKGNGHKTMRVETEPDFHAMVPLPDVREGREPPTLVSDAPSVASSVGSVASSVGSVPTLALGRPAAAAPPTAAAPSAARRPPKKRLPPPSSLPSEGIAGTAGNFATEFQPSLPPSASHFANEPNHSNFATAFKPGLPPPSLPSEHSSFSRVSSGVSSPREQAAASPVDFVNDLNKSIFIHELAVGCSILCQLRRGAPHL